VDNHLPVMVVVLVQMEVLLVHQEQPILAVVVVEAGLMPQVMVDQVVQD
jgi:hypothetical protein